MLLHFKVYEQKPKLTSLEVICFMIIGIMLLFTVQALGELTVLYPVNGAFFTYSCRFIDESWGFAMVCYLKRPTRYRNIY